MKQRILVQVRKHLVTINVLLLHYALWMYLAYVNWYDERHPDIPKMNFYQFELIAWTIIPLLIMVCYKAVFSKSDRKFYRLMAVLVVLPIPILMLTA